ncbi:MAG: bifunctional sulfate adenylyltransferase/adenylylsulfate kinase [Desulfobacterales bacterium]|jgi:sulfate adenylyltransferase|nr:bifunctional sulfate adenylyltransferase/adenylylsulfate kinase [Desulfobacteraceae bacterium]MBT7086609.1 bifunctional sulfate adenylyltransferase/adenylylsulfate kinase [Desulfobacterales bacterium]
MKSTVLVEPHGGRLVNLRADEERCLYLKNESLNMPDIILNERQFCDLELISTGAFSPLEGFMTRLDYESVLDNMRLSNDTLWPIPICLDISEKQSENIDKGISVALRDHEGFLLAVMNVEDKWKVDREKEAIKIFGTKDLSHPGVNYLYNVTGDYYIGGSLEVLSLPLHFDFNQVRRTPAEIRSEYEKLGWKRVVGFKTRNPIHKAQFEMTTKAMRLAKANLLFLPVVGMTKPGDFNHYTRVRCYRKISHYYPPESFMLNLLPLAIRFASSRDALLHMIIFKNYGCTHFIVGHDHAGPGKDSNGKSFYKSDEAQKLAEEYSDEVGVEVMPFKEMVYLPFEEEYCSSDQVSKGTETKSLSGSDIRKRIMSGKKIPEWATFPEVIEELRKAYPPPRLQGLTVFLTGLSGAGKSTIAKVLFSRFMEIGERPVTLLDGDVVRQNLSSELNFSKEHRDINVRRIGFVAGKITKNRGIAICAPIAPYSGTRAEIRAEIEKYGGFIEVFVSTPIDECERRDRKGMYAKARAGLIKGYTGVDDPYEAPDLPEVSIDTTNLTPGEAAQEILLYLGQKRYI